jgi:hypothetical protein
MYFLASASMTALPSYVERSATRPTICAYS